MCNTGFRAGSFFKFFNSRVVILSL
jgi:hypothetical protein